MSKCVICQVEDKKLVNDRRRNEPLILCTNLRSTLLNAARLQQHDRLLLLLDTGGGDNVAADILYHRSCYGVFTHKKELERLADTPQGKTFQSLTSEVESLLLLCSADSC